MNNRANRTYRTFVRMRDFGRDHTADFAANSVGQQSFNNLDSIVAEIELHAASEASGFGRERQGTATRAEAREELRDLVEAISRTASVLPDPTGMGNKFSRPQKDNDQSLLNCARAFATDLVQHVTQFEGHELPELLTRLKAKTDAFEAAIGEQAGGSEDHVASRVALDDAIERGLNLRRTLDAIVLNKYEDNPAALAEWATARHIEQSGRRKDEEPPTPVTPTTPPAH